MQTYIALLRGINVSGQKKIKMIDLKQAFHELGFHNISTYVQSGNVVFQTKEENQNELSLSHEITKQLKDVFHYDIPVIILASDVFKQMINQNPFLTKKDATTDMFYFSFLSEDSAEEQKDLLQTYENEVDQICFGKRVVYLLCQKGYGRSTFTNNFIERKLKVSSTTRNWKTVTKLIELCDGIT